MREDMLEIYESAARLQALINSDDVCLVGGSAASYYAEHRMSVDHDHVVHDLSSRFEIILEALESQGDWVTNRVTPGKIILGEIGGIEAGVRQLIRSIPLEVERAILPSGSQMILPTLDETLRIKAFLLIKRNQTRDYLDVAALSLKFGNRWAASVLSEIDKYYSDQSEVTDAVASQLVSMLGNPKPVDLSVTNLKIYKGVEEKFTNWDTIEEACLELAKNITIS
jgi:hypothetical protein